MMMMILRFNPDQRTCVLCFLSLPAVQSSNNYNGHDDADDDDDEEDDEDESGSRMARGRRIRSDQVNKTQHKVSRCRTPLVELVATSS